MWLSEQFSHAPEPEVSGFGEVTIPGTQAAAMGAEREERLLPLISPGGYAWLPAAGEQVLVLRDGTPCIVGREQSEQEDLSPGDVRLYAGDASITLRGDGRIELTGQIFVNGTEIPYDESTD